MRGRARNERYKKPSGGVDGVRYYGEMSSAAVIEERLKYEGAACGRNRLMSSLCG